MAAAAGYHAGTARRSVTARVPPRAAWGALSRIADLPWMAGARGARLLTGRGTGVGAARLISFEGGQRVEEHVVEWVPERRLTYVAVSGLPLRAYCATISLAPAGRSSTRITWGSYFASRRMGRAEFAAFSAGMGRFYAESLAGLRAHLEGRAAGRPGRRRRAAGRA